MEAMVVILALLVALVLVLLSIATMAERRLKLVRTQIILERKDTEHREQCGEGSIVDTVRMDAALGRVEYWTRASFKRLWRGVKV